MNKYLCLFILVVFQACAQKPWYGDLKFEGKIPSQLSEVSGLIYTAPSLWLIEDNGNKDHIYSINLKGQLIKDYKVKNAKNNDWEDLAKDENGNIFIGNFGNNDNDRKNLSIYKIPNPDKEKGDAVEAEQIKFSYPEQKKFPPKKSKLLYDCEAFFYKNGFLYLITKNRVRPYTGKALIYKVPAVKGSYKAELVGEFASCTNQKFCSITAADISPDGKKVALLSSGRIWLFSNFSGDDFTKGIQQVIDVKHRTQQESICFLDNSTLLVADEQSQTKGRNLYSYKLD
ncbi:MAG: hypothetical protein AB3N18_01240 [Allomuricauda sp.]